MFKFDNDISLPDQQFLIELVSMQYTYLLTTRNINYVDAVEITENKWNTIKKSEFPDRCITVTLRQFLMDLLEEV